MRFLVDENGGLVVQNWLRSQGYEVFSVYESARGIDDDEVIQKAFDENWILISSDKDFGDKVFREQRPHRGVILLRLDNQSSTNKIGLLQRLLAEYSHLLFTAIFQDSLTEINENECIDRAEICGISAADFRDALRAIKNVDKLNQTIDRAINMGVFGVPTFIVDGELFWGNDRLVLLRHYLKYGKSTT